MKHFLPAPWTPHRDIAETIGQAVADALANHIGSHVELGVASSCDADELLTGRPVPLHATVVRMERPLRDVMIFVSSLKEDLVRPLVEVAAATAIAALEVPTGSDAHGALGEWVVEDTLEYETLEIALEQCDALYLEAVYSLELPLGELQMVLGTGLLESASYLAKGQVDPHAEGTPYVPVGAGYAAATTTEPAPETIEAPVSHAAAEPDDVIPEVVVTPAAVGALDALDATFAEQELVAAPMTPVGISADAVTSTPLADVSATRWTDLLSGVEVELSAELGRADLALGDITALNTESVLTLDQLVHEPVTVYVNGTPYATARLVVVDGEYGIEILEVVDQGNIVATLAA